MELNELDNKVIFKNGKRYEFIRLQKPADLTEQNNDIPTVMTHKLTGFEENLYVITEETDDGVGFYFAYKVGNTGLFVNLMDEEVHNQTTELVFEALESEGWE
jgi:hypothetical protein